jgi:hypothetical protein
LRRAATAPQRLPQRDATPQINPLRAARRRAGDLVFDIPRKLPFHAAEPTQPPKTWRKYP